MVKENENEDGIRTTLRYNRKIDRRLKQLLKTGRWQTLSELMRDAMWHGLNILEDEMSGSK